MPAYVIVEIEVLDPVVYEEYKALAPASIAAHGGRYIARGGRTELLEGDVAPRRVVILEFESVERAKAWLVSAEYREARALRHRAARTRMIVIEGLAP